MYHVWFYSLRPPTEPTPEESIPLIVCGDFNGGAECGAVRYLEDGFVDSTFIEDGDPVTSSVKRLPLALPMHDVMKQNDHRPDSSSDPPPTMVVSELISLLVAPKASASGAGEATAWEEPDFNDDSLARLERIFTRQATGQDDTGKAVMTYENVKEWLTIINGQVGRGDEFREM